MGGKLSKMTYTSKEKILKICLSFKGSKKVGKLGEFQRELEDQNKLIKLQIKATKNIIKMEMKKL